MSGDLFRRNRPIHLLDGFYTEWSEHLTRRCLPLFRDSPPSAANNGAVLNDLISYYDTIDHYADRNTIFYFLFPSWHVNSLETSILFLGDIHPRLFLSLIQSFRDPNRNHIRLAAWRELAFPVNHHIDDVKNEVINTVSRLLREMGEAQEGYIQGFSDNWVSSSFIHSSQRGRQNVTVMETAASVALNEEFVRIFREANELRKNTIGNIVDLSDVNQAALFLEGVCEFLAGFRHQQYAAQLQQPNYSVARPIAQHQPERLHDIYVGNLDLNVTRDMLRQMFSRYPSVRKVKINNNATVSPKYGFVSFADENEKMSAMHEMNGAMLLDRPMDIRQAYNGNI